MEMLGNWLFIGYLVTLVYLYSDRCSGWMAEFPHNMAPLWMHLVVMLFAILTWPMQVLVILRKLLA